VEHENDVITKNNNNVTFIVSTDNFFRIKVHYIKLENPRISLFTDKRIYLSI